MKVTTDFDLNTAKWGEPIDARMGVRIETPTGYVDVALADDGGLTIRAREGFLIVVPVASNAVKVRPLNTRDNSPFSDTI